MTKPRKRKWLSEEYRCPIVAYAADVGQEEDWDAVRAKGLATGAEKVIISDLKKEFVEEYIFPAFRSNAIEESKNFMQKHKKPTADHTPNIFHPVLKITARTEI